MKILILCSVLVVAGIISASASYDFETFVREHNKKYGSAIEESMRRAIFQRNREMIEEFNRENAEKLGYKLGLNQLADLTDDELSVRRGLKVPSNFRSYENSPEAERFFANLMANVSDDQIPDEVDWRKVPGRVSEVKDQGDCVSGWAFAVTGTLEGQMVVRTKDKKLVSLSEQNLLDCSSHNKGCDGGNIHVALSDIEAEGGIESEADYPYQAQDLDKCLFNKTKAVFSDKGAYILKQGDEEVLKKTVATFGPVASSICADQGDWIFYQGGIFHNASCANEPGSATQDVLVAGYGHDKSLNMDFWLVKNSWGPKWGEQGYIRMARNQKNLCGIATVATIPTF